MLLCSEFWPRDSRPGCGSHATPRASKAVVSIRRSPRCVNLFRRPPLAGKGFARVRFLPPQPRAIRAQGISSVPLRSRGPQVGRRVHAKEGVHIGCREGSQRHPPFAPTWRGERSGGRGGAKLARRRASRVARRSGATLCGAFSPASRAGFSRRTGWGPTPSVRRGGVVPPGHDASSGMPGRGPTPSPPQTTPAGPQAAPKDLGVSTNNGHGLLKDFARGPPSENPVRWSAAASAARVPPVRHAAASSAADVFVSPSGRSAAASSAAASSAAACALARCLGPSPHAYALPLVPRASAQKVGIAMPRDPDPRPPATPLRMRTATAGEKNQAVERTAKAPGEAGVQRVCELATHAVRASPFVIPPATARERLRNPPIALPARAARLALEALSRVRRVRRSRRSSRSRACGACGACGA